MPLPPLPTDRPLFLVHASVVLTDGDRVLFVEEAKPASRNKWNLPGGHVDHGESPIIAALREAMEEACVHATATHLVGIYVGQRSVRFVVAADLTSGTPAAGDEILSVKWIRLDELMSLPDEQLVSPAMLRQICDDLRQNTRIPLSAVRHVV